MRRFHTPEIQKMIGLLAEARDELEHHRASVLGEYQAAFGEDYAFWKKAVDCVGEVRRGGREGEERKEMKDRKERKGRKGRKERKERGRRYFFFVF